MLRTKAIFKSVFNLESTTSQDHTKWVTIEYVEVAPGIDDANVLLARERKEKAALEHFLKKTVKEYGNSVQSLHRWLFSKHNAYSTHRLVSSEKLEISAEENSLLLKSY